MGLVYDNECAAWRSEFTISWVSCEPAARQHAIALVKGTVVGGFRLGNPEHFYHFRIPYNVASDSIDGPVLHATHVLEALPSIESATIVGLDFLRLQDRGPFDGARYDTLLANLTLAAAASRRQGRRLPRPRVRQPPSTSSATAPPRAPGT